MRIRRLTNFYNLRLENKSSVIEVGPMQCYLRKLQPNDEFKFGQSTIRFCLVPIGHLAKCCMGKSHKDVSPMIFVSGVKSMFQVSDL